MKRTMTGVLLLAGWGLQAQSAWQFLELDVQPRCLFQSETGTFMISNRAAVLTTENGLDWEEVVQLGLEDAEYAWVQKVFNAGSGLSLIVSSHTQEKSENRLYHSVDGMVWSSTVGISAGEGWIQGPFEVSSGWIHFSAGASPAVIWHSTDLIGWMEVYRSDAHGLNASLYSRDGVFSIGVSGSSDLLLLQSMNAKDWVALGQQPYYYLEVDGTFVGLGYGPSAKGDLYTSQDGVNWTRILQSGVGGPGQSLQYAQGMFIAQLGFGHLYQSIDGITWTEATIDRSPIDAMSEYPMEAFLKYVDGAFWYKVRMSPQFGQTEPMSAIYRSVDGLVWELAEAYPGEAGTQAHAVCNPLFRYTFEPGKSAILEPISSEPLDGPAELEIDGYLLRREPVAAGDILGLYLKPPEGDFRQVNTAWRNPGTTEPYPQPYYMVAAGGSFLVLNEEGILGFYDPDGAHLAQPSGLSASYRVYDDRIVLQWDAVEGATHYTVYRTGPGPSSEMTEIAEVSEPFFCDSGELACGESHAYRVAARAANRYSFRSLATRGSVWSVKTGIELPCPCPVCNFSTGPLVAFSPQSGESIILMEEVFGRLYPWIWSSEHGWQYCLESPGNLWLCDSQLGWLWTRNCYYPLLYRAADESWLYYCGGDETRRWFYDFAKGEFEDVER